MIRALFLLISIGFFFTASAQKPTYYQGLGLEMKVMYADSVARIPTDTSTNKTGVARIGTTLYAGNGNYWTAQGGSGSTFDSTSISNRINQKLDSITKNATADSIYSWANGVIIKRIKDSVGTGSFARDTIVAGRGLTATTISANKVQLDNDSAVYIVTQINDTTLSFTHYDGRIDTVTIVSSGGGGGSGWGLTGNAGTTPGTNFVGTTDAQGLMFKVNNTQAGYIDIPNENTSFGQSALINNSTGYGNTVFGKNSLKTATNSIANVAFGYAALEFCTTGDANTGLGNFALQNLTTGRYNLAVGESPLINLVSGSSNVSVGRLSQEANITGSWNTSVGDGADVAATDTDSSGAFGFQATASTRQMAFSPYFKEFKATGITGALTAGNVLTTDGTGIATFQAAGGGSSQWTDTTAGIYYGNKVAIGGAINPTHTLTIGDSLTSQGTVFIGVPETDDVFSIYSITDAVDILHIDNEDKLIQIGNSAGTPFNTGINITPLSTDSNFTVNGSTHLKNSIRASGLPSNQTYFKSLGVTSDGTFYLKDTLAVSGVYATLNGSEALTNKTLSSSTNTFPTKKINGVDFNLSADISTDMYLASIQAMGSTIIGYNLDGNPSNGVSVQNMVSQRAYFTAVRLNKAQTVTGVKWIQTTAGDYTSNNYNGVGLYSYSGGTLTLVASSTDDGNIWKATANTMASKAFSSTYSATAGIYFVAFLYSSSAQTTAPALQILGTAGTTNLILDLTNSAKTSSLLSSQTALPSPTQAMSGLSGYNTEFKAFIY